MQIENQNLPHNQILEMQPNISSIEPTYLQPGEVLKTERTEIIYTIGEKIGEGSFGVVYSCSDMWGNELAVKALKFNRDINELKDEFNKEINKLKLLRHPNIIYIYDSFIYKNAFCIVTERCKSTLTNLVGIQKPYRDIKILMKSISRCILQAVYFMHLNNYVHLDLHLGNIFYTYIKDEILPDSQYAVKFKIGDLGISRKLVDISYQSTMAPWMLPPEVILKIPQLKLDHRIDIYHLGLVFLQILYCRSLRFNVQEILEGTPAKMAMDLNTPEGIVVSKALAPDVNKRIDSVLALWNELNEALSH